MQAQSEITRLKNRIAIWFSIYGSVGFSYGLAVIQQIRNIADGSMSNIDDLIEWYDKIAIINDKLFLSDYGIFDINDLRAFYLR